MRMRKNIKIIDRTYEPEGSDLKPMPSELFKRFLAACFLLYRDKGNKNPLENFMVNPLNLRKYILDTDPNLWSDLNAHFKVEDSYQEIKIYIPTFEY